MDAVYPKETTGYNKTMDTTVNSAAIEASNPKGGGGQVPSQQKPTIRRRETMYQMVPLTMTKKLP